MAVFNNVKNICLYTSLSKLSAIFFKGIFTYGPTKLSQTEIVLPTCQLNDLTYLIKMTYLKDQW